MYKLLAVSIIVSICVIISFISYYFWGSDNPVEEACEGIIKDETGVDIDLSPGSPEKTPSAKDDTGNKAAS